MKTQRRLSLTLAALLGLLLAWPAVAKEYKVTDYLPLAVGNSWTYGHTYIGLYPEDLEDIDTSEWTAYIAPLHFTITVERTEVIDGKTYYVLSDMPADWPPAPSYFIAGKKLRWEGTNLMERTADGEQTLYRLYRDQLSSRLASTGRMPTRLRGLHR